MSVAREPVSDAATRELEMVEEPATALGTSGQPGVAQPLTRCAIMPEMRHASVAGKFGPSTIMDADEFSLVDAVGVYVEEGSAARKGDLAVASRILAAQALTLDGMFTKMAQLAGANLGEYPAAAERYMRLAFKAQANSRTTLEALAKLHRPNEQVVKHVHVGGGGQAVIADEFHHHAFAPPSPAQAENDEQSHGKCAPRATLPSPDTLGNALPMPGSEREEAMSHARRD